MFRSTLPSTEHQQYAGTYTEVWRRWQFFAWGYLIAAVGMWLTWLAPWNDLIDRSGTPFGGDFVMFYAAGEVVLDGASAQLYDDVANQARTNKLIPNLDPHQSWPYRYPPPVALAFAPLAKLSYAMACTLFLLVSLGLLSSAVWMLWNLTSWSEGCHSAKPGFSNAFGLRTLAVLFMGWPVVIETLFGGQLSTLGLWIVAATLTLLRRKCFLASGLVLSLAIYKPNVLLCFVLGILVRFPRLLIGLCCGLIAIVSISGITVGWNSWFDFAELSSRLATANWSLETPMEKVHGLVPWLQPLLGDLARPMLLTIGLGGALTLGSFWRSASAHDGSMVASLLLVNSLFNPYVPIYDLLLLSAVPLMLFGMNRLIDHRPTNGDAQATVDETQPCPRWMEIALFSFYFGPHLSQAIAIYLGWQLFPLWLLIVTAFVLRKTLPQIGWPGKRSSLVIFRNSGPIKAIDSR